MLVIESITTSGAEDEPDQFRKEGTMSDATSQPDPDYARMTDEQLKALLLEMAKRGEPRPGPDTALGRALSRFTTDPTQVN
jgi:hypothetical protein